MPQESSDAAVVPQADSDPRPPTGDQSVDQLYGQLENRIRELRPQEDVAPLAEAYRFAAAQHTGQKRASGEPYMVHPLEVTRLLLEMNLDMTCLQTGLLHDVVEDTNVSIHEIRELFGNDVESIRIVDPETQLSERKLLQVSIIPNIETQFNSGERTSLFEFLPEQTIFWCFGRSFILERIAEEQSIADEPGDYDAEIRAIAAQSGESPRRVRASLEKRGLMDVLRNQIVERKVIDLILQNAQFTEVPYEMEQSDIQAVELTISGRASDIPEAKPGGGEPLEGHRPGEARPRG